jgi:hypothetical protein
MEISTFLIEKVFVRSTPNYENSDIQNQFLMSKIIRILPFFFIEVYKIRNITYINGIFCLRSSSSTLFTKIGPKFQTLIPNRALICQRPLKWESAYFHSINQGLWKLPKNLLCIACPNLHFFQIIVLLTEHWIYSTITDLWSDYTFYLFT